MKPLLLTEWACLTGIALAMACASSGVRPRTRFEIVHDSICTAKGGTQADSTVRGILCGRPTYVPVK